MRIQRPKITKDVFFTEINKYGHIPFVEDMFYDTFDEDIDCILMNAFFWIFSYKGDIWAPVGLYEQFHHLLQDYRITVSCLPFWAPISRVSTVWGLG